MNNRSMTIVHWTGGSLLAFLAACAGRYDVGDESNHAAGAGGSATEATGGSAGSDAMSTGGTDASPGGFAAGGTDTSVGGSDSAAGGSVAGRGSVGGRSSGSTGGSVAIGGGDVGGSAGTTTGGSTGDDPTCGVQLPSLDTSPSAASPETVWQRVGVLLDNQLSDVTPDDLPATTTTNWAAAIVDERLATARDRDVPPAGLVRFMASWLQTDGSDEASPTAESAAVLFNATGATFASLIAPEGGGGLLVDPALNRYRSSISARGAWMVRSLLCLGVGAGPPGSTPGMSGMGLTRRQALEQAVSAPTCIGCHSIIDPPGYALESFDPSTGEPRTTDNGLPIDTSGSFSAESSTFSFGGIEDLASQFATSCDVARCFVTSFTSDATAAVGLPLLTSDETEYVLHEYLTHGQSLNALVLAFVRTPTFLE